MLFFSTIIANEPWSFDKHLMVLQCYNKDSDGEVMPFNSTHFLLQVHRIPIRFLNPQVAVGLHETVGQLLCQPKSPIEDGGGFMRVCVLIVISQPLCRGKVVAFEDNKKQWVSFKYEQLPNLYYWCGCLTHNDRDCDLWIYSEGTLEEANK